MSVKNTTKISIILPAYNAEGTISRCLDSLLAQTFKDFEIIIINDGSKDGTGRIIDEFALKDHRVKPIHKPNGGVSSARNLGLEFANGKWICFCDSDDEVESDWLEAFINGSYESDMVIQSLICEQNDYRNSILLDTKKWTGRKGMQDLITYLMVKCVYGYLFTKSFKREIIKKFNIKFDEECHFREDELFMSEYLAHCDSVQTIPQACYIYYQPKAEKKYKGYAYYAIPKLFKILDTIFTEGYNPSIASSHINNVKDLIVTKVLNKVPVENYEANLYDRLLKHIRAKKIVDRIIISSATSSICRGIIIGKHRLSSCS